MIYISASLCAQCHFIILFGFCIWLVITLQYLILWILEKFHHLLHGKLFQLETDQKLLESILVKSLTETNPQLQQFLTRTFLWYFDVTYVKRAKKQLADQVNDITRHLQATSSRLELLRQGTIQDDELINTYKCRTKFYKVLYNTSIF